MKRGLAVLSLLFGVAMPAVAQGPALGKVHFQVECNADAQREFNVAMAYYHSFAFPQMQPPLERVLQADPKCGMAHWLRTLAALNNPFVWPTIISAATLSEGGRFLDTARSVGLKSQRERDYVDALAVFTAASDAFTERNIGMTVEASLRAFAPVLSRAAELGETSGRR